MSATAHGPFIELATNHTPSWHAYQVLSSIWMTGAEAFSTYCSDVPVIGTSFGSPSVCIVKLALLMSTRAVVGI